MCIAILQRNVNEMCLLSVRTTLFAYICKYALILENVHVDIIIYVIYMNKVWNKALIYILNVLLNICPLWSLCINNKKTDCRDYKDNLKLASTVAKLIRSNK